jgi:hypothetical protein
MTIESSMSAGLAGALTGAVLALLHQHASWRASHALVRSGRSTAVLRGLPLRVGLPALALFAVARWSPTAMIAALASFGVVAVLAARRRLAREGA